MELRSKRPARPHSGWATVKEAVLNRMREAVGIHKTKRAEKEMDGHSIWGQRGARVFTDDTQIYLVGRTRYFEAKGHE